MKARLMPLYRRAPTWLRSLFGTIYGYHLARWRYGPETDRLVHEALDRETWSNERWSAWQSKRVESILYRARHHVPYYRELWDARERSGDERRWEVLSDWPVLSKEVLRARPQDFIADDAGSTPLFRLETSGTSGTPVTTWRSRKTMRAWYALFEARSRRWYGVTRHDRWAILGGQEVVPATRNEPPFWVWNAASRQLYLSTLHVSTANAPAYLGALRKYRVVHIYGYSSSLAELARATLDGGLDAPRMRAVVTNAEPLNAYQRDLISRAFGCPTFSSYGMSEAVVGASECEAGALHYWPDAGILEVFDDDRDVEVPRGTAGRLICTGLLNSEMPLIRYEVGDRGLVAVDSGACACGRTLPRLTSIEGRNIDSIVTADGRRVFWLNPVFYGLPVHEAQLVQTSVADLIVNVVPADGFDQETRHAIVQRLRQRVGDITVDIREQSHIPRGPNGKFQFLVSEVSRHSNEPAPSGAEDGS